MRGQTTLDFAVGTSIFLLALAAVFLFVPGTVAPFTEGGQENVVAANRVATSLSEGLLGDHATPYVLDSACTAAFFADTSPADCRFEGATLTERVGVDDRTHVNVSLRGNLSTDGDGHDLLCWDGSNGLVERTNTNCNQLARIGEGRPQTGTSVAARRLVTINGTDTTLHVVVW